MAPYRRPNLASKTTGASTTPVQSANATSTSRVTSRSSVSAAGIFKQHPKKSSSILLAIKKSRVATPSALRSALVPRAGARDGDEVTSGTHPLAEAFNESTCAYRVALYIEAAIRINTIHASLVSDLHTVTSPNPKPSPDLAFNPATKLQRIKDQLNEAIGTAKLILTYRDEEGHLVTADVELGKRISIFEKQVEKETKRIETLQAEWEKVVGAIWVCGEKVLGREGMETLLLSRPDGKGEGTQLHNNKNTSLFIPEAGDPESMPVSMPAQKGVASAGASVVSAQLPSFIQRAIAKSAKGKHPIIPRVEDQDIQELEKTIGVLGEEQIAGLRKLEREHKRWYDNKTQKVVGALKDD